MNQLFPSIAKLRVHTYSVSAGGEDLRRVVSRFVEQDVEPA